MRFRMNHRYINNTEFFTDTTPPNWLIYEEWFWKDHVLTLEIGKSIDTDFHTITRIEDDAVGTEQNRVGNTTQEHTNNHEQ